MPLITLSRGTFTGSRHLVDRLVARLGYRTVSRKELYQKVHETYGADWDEVATIMERPPTLIEFAQGRKGGQSGKQRWRLFFAFQATLCDLLGLEKGLYHGQAGHLLLPGIQHVLRVRIVTPRAHRIANAMGKKSINRIEAIRRIEQVDSERARWTRAFYGVDWSDPTIFDLVLNLDTMSRDEAVDLIETAQRLPSFQITEASRNAMSDLYIQSRIMARLLYTPETADLGLTVEAEGGHVKLRGDQAYANLPVVQEIVAEAKESCRLGA